MSRSDSLARLRARERSRTEARRGDCWQTLPLPPTDPHFHDEQLLPPSRSHRRMGGVTKRPDVPERVVHARCEIASVHLPSEAEREPQARARSRRGRLGVTILCKVKM